MSDIDAFNSALPAPWKAVCDALQEQFDQRLGLGNSRLYHGSPVWFIEGNPLVGYSLKKAGVAKLDLWLTESKTIIGDYKNIIKRNGTLELLQEGRP